MGFKSLEIHNINTSHKSNGGVCVSQVPQLPWMSVASSMFWPTINILKRELFKNSFCGVFWHVFYHRGWVYVLFHFDSSLVFPFYYTIFWGFFSQVSGNVLWACHIFCNLNNLIGYIFLRFVFLENLLWFRNGNLPETRSPGNDCWLLELCSFLLFTSVPAKFWMKPRLVLLSI